METLSLPPSALLGVGFLLGLRHAADPDHVVAVTAIASRSRRAAPAAWLGVAWGAGHTLTLWLVGAAIILFGLVVPPRLGLALEFAVALALIGVGLLNLRHTPHDTTGFEDGPQRPLARRAFVVGLVHGLAGSAAVALLVLASVREPWLACAYLGVFAIGTLAGMVLVTTGLAWPVVAVSARFPLAPRTVRWATGMLSVGFGLWLAYQIGHVDGLFGPAPAWMPH